MKTNDWIRKHLFFLCGMPEQVTAEQLEKHVEGRVGRAFALIRKRVAMGFLRYESNRGRSPCYLDWLETSLSRYKETKNTDALLDVAFYAIAEFENPSVEGTHYRPDKEDNERDER